MKTKTILLCFLIILLSSCIRTSCDKVTEKDIIGVYVSMNPLNKNKQYMEAFADGSLYMLYCDEELTIEEWGEWRQIDGCHVIFDGVRWFNITPLDTLQHSASFSLINGKLSIGDDDFCFKKVRHKPELYCNK